MRKRRIEERKGGNGRVEQSREDIPRMSALVLPLLSVFQHAPEPDRAQSELSIPTPSILSSCWRRVGNVS